MITLRQAVSQAGEDRKAIGHFNVSTIDAIWAIFNAVRDIKAPAVIIGVSEGERDFIGLKQIVALVKSIRDEYDYPIFLNADHSYSFERVKDAIDAGFDSVIFDGAKLGIEDNIIATKQCVGYARSVNPEIIVEGELGYIGDSSKVFDEIPASINVGEDNLTTPKDAKDFIEATGIDLFAPAVGSIHGMLKRVNDPDVNIERLKDIAEISKVPLVLHGASGLRAENVSEAIKAGMSIVHVNTELRVVWKNAIKLAMQDDPEEVTPYKILKPAMQAMKNVVGEKLKLFNRI
ncbi:MAG: class II fructose-bisphosphate aldolase [Candidatus Vogelbacteria bacterium]|nr:class II fructose-bisphosphate aldolase [Candidatus Vogelbacteria bacterium]